MWEEYVGYRDVEQNVTSAISLKISKIYVDQVMSSLPEVSRLGGHVVALVAQVPHTLVHPRLVQLQVARRRRHVVTLATRMDF